MELTLSYVRRRVADLLTFVRLSLGLLFFYFGAQRVPVGSESLRLVLLGWLTDSLDGPLARSSGMAPSWLGQRDGWIDLLLASGLLFHFVREGYVTPWLLLAQLLLLAAYLLFRVDFFSMTYMASVWFLAILAAWTLDRRLFAGICVYLALLLLFSWGRFLTQVRRYFESLRILLGRGV